MGDLLSQLAGKLASGEPGEREEAARELAEAGDPRAGAHLARALRDPEETVRTWAAYGLSRLQRPEDEPVLRRALAQDKSATVRLWAAFGMVAFGDRAEVATLLSFLDDESLDVRNNAADALLSLAATGLVRAPLERRLSSSQPRTRAWAAGVLHRLGHPQAFEVWRRALFSSEARIDAAVVAHHLGKGPAARELLKALGEISRDELEAPVAAAGGLPAAEVLSAPLLELDLPGLLEAAPDDAALRTGLLLLLGRGLAADPEVLGQVHGCLAALDEQLLCADLVALLTRTPGAERALLLARVATYLPERVQSALEALDPPLCEAVVGRVVEAVAEGGERAFEFSQLVELLRASPLRALLGKTPEAARTLEDEEEPETQPGVTVVDAPVTAPPTEPARGQPRRSREASPRGSALPGPNTPSQAASRALCVAAVLHRFVVEQALSSGDLSPEEAQANAEELAYWVEKEKLAKTLSPIESALLDAEPGAWADEERVEASWAAEALGMLLWALGAAEQAAPDEPADLSALMEKLPLLADTAAFVRKARLRPAPELSAQRELWELWRFRARAEVAARNEGNADGPRADCLAAASRLREQGLLPRTVAGDFPFRGKAFQKIDEAELSSATSISLERHRALHWLSLGGQWDQVALERG